jgi:hypothetical protein
MSSNKKKKKVPGAILETDAKIEQDPAERRHVNEVKVVAIPDKRVPALAKQNKLNALVKNETQPCWLEKQFAFAISLLPLDKKPQRVLTINSGFTGAAVASRMFPMTAACFTPAEYEAKDIRSKLTHPDATKLQDANFMDIQQAVGHNAEKGRHVYYLPGQDWEDDRRPGWTEMMLGKEAAARTFTLFSEGHWAGGADVVHFNLNPRNKGGSIYAEVKQLLSRLPERGGPVVFLKLPVQQLLTNKDDAKFEAAKKEDGAAFDAKAQLNHFPQLAARRLLVEFVKKNHGWHAIDCNTVSGFMKNKQGTGNTVKWAHYIVLFFADEGERTKTVAYQRAMKAVHDLRVWMPRLYATGAKQGRAIGHKQALLYSDTLRSEGFSINLGKQLNTQWLRAPEDKSKKQPQRARSKKNKKPRRPNEKKKAAAAAVDSPELYD